ncbi:hypothetical protein OOK29_25345 [Streptomyces phaeochromogenes]|uniref:Uncharacterized protein n=1 Tax=Streptomyces phaeochromogenes TaxID=1923 RepID=A0ABZ1HCP6_STRPH|nr:hypothetical protein [Streptomyces phaeochromogenes]MCX5601477.1 hypothetical protein [Streptomyces phaeochromogenes]WSD15111.1 hypothetical protein OHB35_18690 [Streptomyces phaeochromogenes]WSJ08061.1 hypothetical protein OG437_32725 [Streptomyces phaeochromogenes]
MGTLLGSALTHLFQRRAARDGAREAHQQLLRAERMTAYSTFAAAAVAASRAQLDRWHRPRENPGDPENDKVRLVAYERRSEARQAFFRVQLIASNPEVVSLARIALESSRPIARASDEDESRRLTDECRAAIEAFVIRAAGDVQQT